MTTFVMFISSWNRRKLTNEIIESDSLLGLLKKSNTILADLIYDGDVDAYDVEYVEEKDGIRITNNSYDVPKKLFVPYSKIEFSYDSITYYLSDWCSVVDNTKIQIKKY